MTLALSGFATAASVGFLLFALSVGFEIPVVVLALPFLAFLATFIVKYLPPWKLGENWFPLLPVFILSGILRLAVAYTSSYYPDEYGVWALLNVNPIFNVVQFLRNYPFYAGRQAVHPPLGFLLMSTGYDLAGSLEGARLVSVLFGLASIIVVYWLVILLHDRKAAALVASIFALLPQTIVFLSLALTDPYVLFFGISSITSYVWAVKTGRTRGYLASGFLLGLAFWSKLAIPTLWAFAILISALFLKEGIRQRRIFGAVVSFLIAGVFFLAWGWVFPPFLRFTLRIIFLQRFDFGEIALFPIITTAIGTIGYLDLLLQIPAWFTSIIILFAIYGTYLELKERDTSKAWILIWGLTPLAVFIPYLRDIRYLLISAVPVSIMALVPLRSLRIRRVEAVSILLIFLAVGSVGFLPIVQQEYAGVKEASHVLTELGLADGVVLTNALQLEQLLPNAKVLYLSPKSDSASIAAILDKSSVDAVLIMHHRRGLWPPPAPAVMGLLQSHFGDPISSDPARYTWYQIFSSRKPSAQMPPSVPAVSPATACGVLPIRPPLNRSSCRL